MISSVIRLSRPLILMLLVLQSIGALDLHSAAPLPYEALSTTLEKLIEVRSLEAQAKADWLKEKAILEAQASNWSTEFSNLEKKMETLHTQLGQFEPAQSSSIEEQERLRAVFKLISESLDGLETSLSDLFPRLPTPLMESLAPYQARLRQPSQGAIRSLDSRCRNIVYLLDRIHEFDQRFTLHWETRKHPDESEVLVQVLYLGLSHAYFVDASGDIAGTGKPEAESWTWRFDPSLAEAIQDAIAIHDRRIAPKMIHLPAQVE